MKKKLIPIVLILLSIFLSISCTDNDDLPLSTDLQIKNFVWKGMNQYYLWQESVPDLADNRFAANTQLNSFLEGFSTPTNLFNSLRVNNTIDRFSVIYSDYNVLEGILNGNTLNNGISYGLKLKTGSTTDLFGFVKYILPNSDASTKNISRGMLFYGINGTQLTNSNFRTLLSNTTYTINFADYNNGQITPNGTSITFTKTNLSENPVLLTNVINQGTKKIGYLVYNGFFATKEVELNNAFANFQAQGVTHLVLDLRYNSGGAILTANRLASMITGQFAGQVFAKEQWNSKLTNYLNPSNLIISFTNSIGNGSSISSLNLSKVIILTSKSTASASELVINGLKPYINVVQIGDVTTGKNVGSTTLYDSPNFRKNNVNPAHKYAMQPIVLKINNAAGFGDYQNGLQPTVLLPENLNNLGVLGDVTEPLLQSALNYIQINGRHAPQNFRIFKSFKDDRELPLQNEMYLEGFR